MTWTDRSLAQGLIAYDRRHGWRGPLAEGDASLPLPPQVEKLKLEGLPPAWKPAIVTKVSAAEAVIRLVDGQTGRIPLKRLKWARQALENQTRGPVVAKATEVLARGQEVPQEELERSEVAKGEDQSSLVADGAEELAGK